MNVITLVVIIVKKNIVVKVDDVLQVVANVKVTYQKVRTVILVENSHRELN